MSIDNNIATLPVRDPYLDVLVGGVARAQKELAQLSQSELKRIVREMGAVLMDHVYDLARMAVDETGMGRFEDKAVKNQFAIEIVLEHYLKEDYVGLLESNPAKGVQIVGVPMGVILGVVPTTNPTSTVLFKILISLLSGNGIVVSPHPRAKNCSIAAAKLALDAAVAAGAPEGIVAWVDNPSTKISFDLMHHPGVKMIIATGGPGMVRAAYESGHAALGVGSGNVPVLVDATADIEEAVAAVLESVTFDNGVVCATERTVVAEQIIAERLIVEFEKRGTYFLSDEEKALVAKIILNENGALNPEYIGKSAFYIAQSAGVDVSEETTALIAYIDTIGPSEAFSFETLSPLLAISIVDSFEEAVDVCEQVVRFGGMGHTAAIHIDECETEKMAYFADQMEVSRIVTNEPAAHGAIGGLVNFALNPSMTLGCGTAGGGSISENVGPQHLVNKKTITFRRNNMQWFIVPPRIFFKYGCLERALHESLEGKKRAVIVTDRPLFDLGALQPVREILDDLQVPFKIFFDVKPDPTFETIYEGLEVVRDFKPDVIIAFGGGSPMDAAKIMWLLYEHPEVDVTKMATTFLDIKRKVYPIPALGKVASLIAIPTTSGTGSEVTPFAVVTDERTGVKYPLADYALTPSVAIVDPFFVMHMPKSLTAFSGIDALTHALESLVSVLANPTTIPLSLQAIELIFEYLSRAYEGGASDVKARCQMHYAAMIAAQAFANAFLGAGHATAHKLGSKYGIPHGLANALLIVEVIRFNAVYNPPRKQTFSQYPVYRAVEMYAKAMPDVSGTDMEKVDALIEKIQALKVKLDIPLSIREVLEPKGITGEMFLADVKDLAFAAFEDQCTGANPRVPSLPDLEGIYLRAWGTDNV